MTIQLQLLGGFGATAGGRPIEGLRAAGPTRLLAYLALQRTTRARRIYLAALFWPDGSDVRARRRLSHTLWVLQSALADIDPTLIQADRDSIGLNPHADLWVDAAEFERQIDAFEARRREGTAHLQVESLVQTIDLYQGDLLSDHYDEWMDPIRHRLREKYLLGLRQLVQLHKGSGEHSAALVSARQLVTETPLAEHAHAELMRLYWLAGRADESIAQHRVCAQILAEELGVEPSYELNALRDRIVAERRPPQSPAFRHTAGSVIDEDALVGRAEHRRRLLDTVDMAFSGTGGIALLEGHAGMGRTKLLANVAEAARWRGATVVSARTRPGRRLEPYDAISSALSKVVTGLRREQVLSRLSPDVLSLAARVVPPLSDGAPNQSTTDPWRSPEERWRLQESLIQVCATLGAAGPTTLILDDLQWADPETLEFLRLAAGRLTSSQVSVILSYRTQEARNNEAVWALLTDLEMGVPAVRVSLGGLHHDEIAALATSRSSIRVSPDLVDQLDRAKGGNPLFIIETLRSLELTASAAGDDRVHTDLAVASVDGVTEILKREIETASPTVQSLVGALAVWGSAANSSVLSRLTHLDVTETLDAIKQGIAAEFVSEVEGAYGLRFDQLALAARSRLSDADTREFHLRAANLRAEDPLASASELAAHYREAESWPEAARFEAAAAARAASLHAYESAVRYYELALKSLENAGSQPSPALLFGFENVLDTLGRRDDQADILERLESSSTLTLMNRIRVLECRALFCANTDEFAEAIRSACAAVGFAVACELTPTPYIVSLARVLIMAGQPDLARRQLEGLVADHGSATTLAQARLVLGQALTDVQDLEGAEEQLELALDLFRLQGDTRGQVEALGAIAVLQSHLDNVSAALQHYDEAIELARQIGNRYNEGTALGNLALLNYLIGNGSAALEYLHEALEVFVAIGHRRGEAMVRANSASIRHTVVGDDERAEREATIARRYYQEIDDERHEAQCLNILAGIRRRKRAFAVSRKLLQNALELMSGSNDHWLDVQMLRSSAQTELDAGNPDAAADALDLALETATTFRLDLELPSLLALRARCFVHQGDPAAAMASAQESYSCTEESSELTHLAAWWRFMVFDALDNPRLASLALCCAHQSMLELVAGFDADDRELSLSRIPEHRNITDAFAAHFPQKRTARLTMEDGRGADVAVEFKWTVHHPDDLHIKNKKARRQTRLLRILAEAETYGAHARLEDLAAALDTSVSTLKRDMATLRADGQIG